MQAAGAPNRSHPSASSDIDQHLSRVAGEWDLGGAE
jgi:hypothetical protein